jgi:hypothetical protein
MACTPIGIGMRGCMACTRAYVVQRQTKYCWLTATRGTNEMPLGYEQPQVALHRALRQSGVAA